LSLIFITQINKAMNKLNKVLLPSLLTFTLISCGSADKKNDSNDQSKADNTASQTTVSNPMAGADNKSTEDTYAAKMKERKAKGDTLAMPTADLQKYLPQTIDGYTAGLPTGGSVNMGSMSYSSANISFKKANGDWVRVSIIDYNQAYNLYSTASAVWKMGISVDSPEKKQNSIKLDNTEGGIEDYNNKSKDASIKVGVGSRFWVAIEANNQTDTEMLKSIAKSMDLSKMAAM
jgi:hypothetical protein